MQVWKPLLLYCHSYFLTWNVNVIKYPDGWEESKKSSGNNGNGKRKAADENEEDENDEQDEVKPTKSKKRKIEKKNSIQEPSSKFL